MNELKSLDNKIKVKPYSPNLGGVVTGVDLSKEISGTELAFIKDAFNQYQVLFFMGFGELNLPFNKLASGHFLRISWPSVALRPASCLPHTAELRRSRRAIFSARRLFRAVRRASGPGNVS